MKKTFYVVTATAALSLLLLQAHFAVGIRTHAAATAQGQNVLLRVASTKEPVEITRLQVGDNDITVGTSFSGDENWISALSCNVRNTSGKIITYMQMSVEFEAGGDSPRKVAIPLTSTESIQPNQIARLSAPTANIASLRGLLAKQALTANFRRGELRTQYAKFADGSVWVKGVILSPPDSKTGRRKRM